MVQVQVSPVEVMDPAESTTSRDEVLSARLYEAGTWSVVEIGGEMDLQVVPVLRRLRTQDASHLVFDLRRVTFMDCGGLGALASCSHTALQSPGCVRVVTESVQVRKFLALTHVDRAVSLFDSLEDALSAPVLPRRRPR